MILEMKDIDIHVHVYDFVSLIKENTCIQCIFEWGTCMCAYKLYRTYTKGFFLLCIVIKGPMVFSLKLQLTVWFSNSQVYIWS